MFSWPWWKLKEDSPTFTSTIHASACITSADVQAPHMEVRKSTSYMVGVHFVLIFVSLFLWIWSFVMASFWCAGLLIYIQVLQWRFGILAPSNIGNISRFNQWASEWFESVSHPEALSFCSCLPKSKASYKAKTPSSKSAIFQPLNKQEHIPGSRLYLLCHILSLLSFQILLQTSVLKIRRPKFYPNSPSYIAVLLHIQWIVYNIWDKLHLSGMSLIFHLVLLYV